MTETIASDLQPVLDGVAESAARVCGAMDARVSLIEGDELQRVAHYGPLGDTATRGRLSRDTIPGRAFIDRRVVHVEDVQALPVAEEFRRTARNQGARTVLAVPLLSGDVAIGTLAVAAIRVSTSPMTPAPWGGRSCSRISA